MRTNDLFMPSPAVLEPALLDARHDPVPNAQGHGARAARPGRRRFIVQAAAGGGLLLGVSLTVNPRRADAASPSGAPVQAWIRISSDDLVTVLVGSSDMGQGVLSGFAQVVGDELRATWSQMRAEHAPASPVFGNPAFRGLQLTGGSNSIRGYYNALRQAGAAARELLILAAASIFKVSSSSCVAANGRVTVTGTAFSASYGQLAATAATLSLPGAPAVAAAPSGGLIGRSLPRVDLPSKVDGSAIYGLDVRVPNMLYAVIKQSPVLGGTVQSTPSQPAGTLAVVNLGNAVAVVATGTWAAFKAARELSVSWNKPADAAQMDSVAITARARELMANGTPAVAVRTGDTAGMLQGNQGALELTYELPYLAHACMEVLCCTAEVTATECRVWAPTQGQASVVATAAQITGLDPSRISVTTTMLGGGLGRKIEQDFIAQAIRTAKAMGRPVKLMWPREEDFSHDYYRPMTLSRIRAVVDSAGDIPAWSNRIVAPSISAQRRPLPASGVDNSAVEGANDIPYAIGSTLVEFVRHDAPVPVGYWRSVGHSINAFAVESAIDELAARVGMDPLAFRRRLLAGSPRLLAVLDAAAQLAGWGQPLAVGRAQGLALHASFGSIVAQVAEVSQPAAGSLKIHRISCAIDCGTAINPDSVKAQMEGGIVHGLTAALWGKMTFSKGRANSRNFNGYRMMRASDMPRIDVQIVQTGGPLGGVGEPGVPPVAPAVANALARLTGQRIRSLPMFPAAATMGDD